MKESTDQKGTFGAWAGWILCAALVTGEASVRAWSEVRSGRELTEVYPSVLRWLPAGDPLAWSEVPVNPAQVVGLRYDRGRQFQMRNESGASVDVLYLDFDAGHADYHYDLLSHPPQYCMGMAGWQVLEVFPDRVVSAAGEPVRVQSLEVRSPEGKVAHVFKAIWIHSAFGFNGQLTRSARVRLALQPLPAPPACIFVAAVSGVADNSAAWEYFNRQGLEGFRQMPSRLIRQSAALNRPDKH